MIMIMCCGLVEVVEGLQYITCCNYLCMVECAKPLLDHCIEKA